jgi:hypothetical protein
MGRAGLHDNKTMSAAKVTLRTARVNQHLRIAAGGQPDKPTDRRTLACVSSRPKAILAYERSRNPAKPLIHRI